jgi:hypothetical protein
MNSTVDRLLADREMLSYQLRIDGKGRKNLRERWSDGKAQRSLRVKYRGIIKNFQQ